MVVTDITKEEDFQRHHKNGRLHKGGYIPQRIGSQAKRSQGTYGRVKCGVSS